MENIIEITNVRKIYRTYQKKSGLKNMIKNMKSFVSGMCETNSYILSDEDNNCVIFDPEGKVRTTQRFLSPIGKLVEATKNYLVFQGAFDGLPFMKIISLFDYVVFRVEFGFIESVSETESGFLLKTKESLIFLTSIDSLFLQYPSIDLQHKIDEVEGYNYVVSFDKNKDDFAVTLATSDHETIIITGRKYELIQVIPCPW